MACIHPACLIIIYVIFYRNYRKWKKESDGVDDDVYILHVKRYATRIYSGLVRWYDTWWYVHVACQENCI
jgi:hypothetical protein